VHLQYSRTLSDTVAQGKSAAMGLAAGVQPIGFGETEQAAVDIAGLVVSSRYILMSFDT
jgi:hypothetical protein